MPARRGAGMAKRLAPATEGEAGPSRGKSPAVRGSGSLLSHALPETPGEAPASTGCRDHPCKVLSTGPGTPR